MTPDAAREVLGQYALDAPVTLGPGAQRENTVWRVDTGAGAYALRCHRKGYRSDAELEGELSFMDMLARGGLTVPDPVRTRAGRHLVHHDERQWSLLTWLPGIPLGRAGVPLDPAHGPATFAELGRTLARLHLLADGWTPPHGFTRPDWRRDGLLGDAPVWGRFWDHPDLTTAQQGRLAAFRDHARDILTAGNFDAGLIHADPLRENVLVDGAAVYLIDFDDSATGYRLFEIATALIRNRDEPNYGALHDALIAGYREHRPIDISALPLFMALRATTYIGWIKDRGDLPDAAVRTATNIDTALELIDAAMP